MKKYKIIQIPIYMKTRKYGDSKINLTEIISALCYLIKIFLKGEQKHPAAWSSKRRYNRISGDSFMHVTRRENRNILN
jgi:hypothetical protein